MANKDSASRMIVRHLPLFPQSDRRHAKSASPPNRRFAQLHHSSPPRERRLHTGRHRPPRCPQSPSRLPFRQSSASSNSTPSSVVMSKPSEVAAHDRVSVKLKIPRDSSIGNQFPCPAAIAGNADPVVLVVSVLRTAAQITFLSPRCCRPIAGMKLPAICVSLGILSKAHTTFQRNRDYQPPDWL